jgi:hypothetical protein
MREQTFSQRDAEAALHQIATSRRLDMTGRRAEMLRAATA